MRIELVFFAWVALSASHWMAPEPDGYYTDAQANRGQALYRDACAACHGLDLAGGVASPLAGPQFARGWNPGNSVSDFSGWGSSSVDDLFFIMRTTMPQGAVGSVTAEQHIAVMSGRPSAFWATAHSGAPTVFVFAIPEPIES